MDYLSYFYLDISLLLPIEFPWFSLIRKIISIARYVQLNIEMYRANVSLKKLIF
jgi:hypothetical protein